MERPFRASFTKGKTAVTTPTIVILKRPLSGLSEPDPGPGLLMAYCSAWASFAKNIIRNLIHEQDFSITTFPHVDRLEAVQDSDPSVLVLVGG